MLAGVQLDFWNVKDKSPKFLILFVYFESLSVRIQTAKNHGM